MGESEGTESHLNRAEETKDVSCRSRSNSGGSKGAVGEVEKTAKGGVSVRVRRVPGRLGRLPYLDELDQLSASLWRNPRHFSPKTARDIKVDYLCHESLCCLLL